MPRRSKDNVYTVFDLVADSVRDWTPSPQTKKTLESIGRATVKALGKILVLIITGKAVSGAMVMGVLDVHNRKVAKEVGKDLKKKIDL